MSRSGVLSLGLVLVTAAACAPPPKALCGGTGCGGSVEVGHVVFAQSTNNRMDLLFIVDPSEPLPASLVAELPRFMQPITDDPSPFDVRVGIIRADLAADGALQTAPVGTTCAEGHLADGARFLEVTRATADCPARTTVEGDLGAAFACHAALPPSAGPGQPLEAMRRALSRDQGFLRENAFLAVVFLGARDDCSTPADTALFDADAPDLGPPGPYRCFRYGAVCAGGDPGTAPGERTGCAPGAWDPDPRHQLVPVEEYVAFLKGLKPADPRMVYVGVVSGPPTPVTVRADATGAPALAPSCARDDRAGYPGLRFERLVAQLDGDRARFVSACGEYLTDAYGSLFYQLAVLLGLQCLGPPLRDRAPDLAGLQPDLVVTWRTWEGSNYAYEPVPPCDPRVCDPLTADCAHATPAVPASAPGCWYIWQDPAACPRFDSSKPDSARWAGYQLRIARGGALCDEPPPIGAYAVVDYAACAADPATASFDCSPGCAFNWPACCPTPHPGCERE
ncbi:MAG TPA: hypothetical protein VGQ83_20805 [Polyangia bacterium]|jgi:hypothetical protein